MSPADLTEDTYSDTKKKMTATPCPRLIKLAPLQRCTVFLMENWKLTETQTCWAEKRTELSLGPIPSFSVRRRRLTPSQAAHFTSSDFAKELQGLSPAWDSDPPHLASFLF